MEKREFARRRKRLMDLVEPGSIIIQPNAPERVRNRDVFYPYRADSDFYYLSGFPEPESLMVLVPDRAQGEFLLFCREKDEEQETWHGRRAGLEGACEEYGADDAFPITDLDDILPGLLENKERIYYTMGRYADFDQRLVSWLNRVTSKGRAGVHAPDQFVSLGHVVHEMRLFKSSQELKAMRRAASIAAAAHARAMAVCRPGMREYQIEAELLHCFMQHGARAPAYPSIVGSGPNSCILHYTENGATMKEGDLLLIDAGAEYDYYASDVTRTFPVSGEFSETQRQVYEVVLAAQAAAIAEVRPGNGWNEPHEAAVEEITRGLVDLGILKGRLRKLIDAEAYRPYYMHKTGHWLGMDVHDVGDYKLHDEWRIFEPGMVTTVEPGLYFPAGLKDLPKQWWNIGVRIEDDVLVTETGHEVLSIEAPKSVEDVETTMQQHRAA
ncbi:MAG: Xaa-Pro aminopeptidase [Gammaproteobacteria bacterium]|nr:Xaa-Pro aminopeptidase [Gammaproteobacteria bacterium]MCP5200429.1 Xaa-Pro aminopeptidase [Gammaproteobacteria bacterium]